MSNQTLAAHGARRLARVGLMALTMGAILRPGVSAQEAPSHTADPPDQRPNVEVMSSNWMDAQIYLVRDGLVTPLGFVMGPGEATLVLPRYATIGTGLQLLVMPIGTRDSWVSPVFSVDPNDVVELRIENSLSLSNLSIAPRA